MAKFPGSLKVGLRGSDHSLSCTIVSGKRGWSVLRFGYHISLLVLEFVPDVWSIVSSDILYKFLP